MKKTKRIMLLIIALAIVIVPATHVYGAVSADTRLSQMEDKINRIIGGDITYTVERGFTLKSIDEESKYVCYDLYPYGYAIYNSETGSFEEISHNSEEIPIDIGQQNYYFGPNSYFYKDNGIYKEVGTDYVLDSEDLVIIKQKNDEKKAIENVLLSPSNNSRAIIDPILPVTEEVFYITNKTYFTSLLGDDFGNNLSETCTMVATQILLGYYDVYHHHRFVSDNYRSGYGTTEAFHQLMIQYINPTGGPGSISAAKDGVSQYIIDNVIPYSVDKVIGNHIDVFDVVSSKISFGEPVLTALFNSYNSDAPYNHSVVTYGYSKIWLGSTYEVYYHTHTGWHGTSLLTYNYLWFADALYLTFDP